MLSQEASTKSLQRLFRHTRVVDLDALYRTLKTRSRMTVFRRLKDLDYCSSYSHAGRYYTLADVPRFDEHGLWLYHGIGFSEAGTLKNTVVHLVRMADAGRTHPELQQMVRVRVHNTLLSLVREARIDRQPIERMYLYVNAESERAAEQFSARRELLSAAKKEPIPLPSSTIIEVLIEAIRVGQVTVGPTEVARRLTARGLTVTEQQVEQVFVRYGLGVEKKTAE